MIPTSEPFNFPKGFLWGAATSAHQVEGNNYNDWTEWESANSARLAASAAKRHANAPTRIPDYILEKYPNPLQEENYISGRACDHYNRFREDFDIAKSLGHNAHRFSIEWSRIESEEGKFNEKEIEHYREVILALRERGLEPFVTLWHWTLPIWVREQGGWENKKIIDYYARYVEKVVSAIRGIKFWMPLNEPGVYVGLGYIQGVQPPGIRNLLKANKVFQNLMEAFRKAAQIIREQDSDAKVGISHYAAYTASYKNFPWNRLLAFILHYIKNIRFLNSVKKEADFIGIQYYHTDFINLKLGGRFGILEIKNPNQWLSDMNWQIYPEGLYHILKWAGGYNKPVYITENGVADSRDIHRERFLREHLERVRRAIKEGVDIRGYFYWSLLDNFEMPRSDGFWPRFGLVEVDYQPEADPPLEGKTMERKIRQSAWEYKKIIESGIES